MRQYRPWMLDWLNFLLADVRGALGPYLGVFLVTQIHWSQSEVGVVTMLGGLLGLAVQTPIGAALDVTRAKRALVVVALAALAGAALLIFAVSRFWAVAAANLVMAVAGDVFGPAVAALTLGLVARAELARRMGRNSAFDHAGNVVIALLAGAVGSAVSQRAVFLLVPLMAIAAGVVVLAIPAAAIDHDRARDDGAAGAAGHAAGWRVLLESRALLVFAASVLLFHLANAALLPLVGQKLAAAHPDDAAAMLSACIVAAQLVMLPIALLVGARADRWGWRKLLAVAFVVLPVRAMLYTLSDSSTWLIGVQLLDGVAAGIFGALTPLAVADIMRGSGRFNLALGAVATAQGIGASASGMLAGVIVDRFGYGPTFLSLAALAAAAAGLFGGWMPKTRGDG